MSQTIVQVDAFTDTPFLGNPEHGPDQLEVCSRR